MNIQAYERSLENQEKVNKLKTYAKELGLKPYDLLQAWQEENMKICVQNGIYGFILNLDWNMERGSYMELRSYKQHSEEDKEFMYANSFINKPQD